MAHEHFIDKRGDQYITPHLQRHEIACHCGCGLGKNTNDFDIKTAKVFEKIRKAISMHMDRIVPITINSGCRCWEHHVAIYKRLNKEPTIDSKHLKKTDRMTCAMDLKCPKGLDFGTFLRIVQNIIGNSGGVGAYPYDSFVHFDTRGYKARW